MEHPPSLRPYRVNRVGIRILELKARPMMADVFVGLSDDAHRWSERALFKKVRFNASSRQ